MPMVDGINEKLNLSRLLIDTHHAAEKCRQRR